MLSRAERKRRKAAVDEAVMDAYYTLKRAEGVLDFNKRLKRQNTDIRYRLLLLHNELEGKR